MKEDLLKRLLAVFQAEHKEHAEYIRGFLSRSEKAGGASPGPDLDEAFRRAHSLKGAARAVDLPPIQSLAHRVETLFARVREGKFSLDKDSFRAVRQALDASEDWAAATFEKRPLPDISLIMTVLEKLLGMEPEAGSAGTPASSVPGRESPLSPVALKTEAAPSSPDLPLPAVSETLRVRAEDLDRLLDSTDSLISESLRQQIVGRDLSRMNRDISKMEKEWERTRRGAALPLQEMARDPRYARVVHFVDSMAHAVQSLSRQARAARQLHQRSTWSLGHGADRLRRDVRQARMVPAETVFQGFRKMVRDLARDEGKDVDFKLEGLSLQADRAVLQSLKDPVMHMLRNALGHGIEAPDERRKAGKEPTAALSLTIETLGNRLVLTVEDDGRGLNLDRIRETAVQKKMISEADAGRASAEDLTRLIFRPGFSTARGVTDLSGRGMGLSVVAETVARLQGSLQLPPKKGPGTRMVLSVPLTISTHRILLLSAAGRTFAVPVLGIEKMLRVKKEEIKTVEGKPSLILDGTPYPLQSLAQLLGVGKAVVSSTERYMPVLILRTGQRRLALVVESFLSERESMVKELTGPAAGIDVLMGAVVLEDGEVAPVLDAGRLVESTREAQTIVFKEAAADKGVERASRILVVDDSITTRTLEKSLLEAHGYFVQIAVDGLEALSHLRSDAFDLVITDIEMPRMDGFGLLQEIKKDARLSKIPVIVVTSLEKKEDQQRGLALGADAYVVKRKFDQHDLLETIRQIL
jgi:two-component system, chemotaxis family, sensor kinase CheA